MPHHDADSSPQVVPPPIQRGSDRSPSPVDDQERGHERRNFWLLVLYQTVLRTGWIFKTESSIMPAAADALDPTGLARGWLQPLNRFGQSIPPLIAAPRIKNLPKKKRAFIATTASMTLCFLGLTSLWLIPGLAGHPSAAVIYLGLYGFFFWAMGVNGLAYNTIQGKLIRPTWRGRLLMIADFVGGCRAEGIVPAPEPTHALAACIEEALRCKETGEPKVILTALCGHGHLDLAAYQAYLSDSLEDHELSDEDIQAAMAALPAV